MPLYGRLSAAGKTKAPRAVGKMKTTAINIPVDTWMMLRAVAFARAQETGERPSVSALIAAEQRKIKRELNKLKNQQLQIQSERSWQCLRSGTVC